MSRAIKFRVWGKHTDGSMAMVDDVILGAATLNSLRENDGDVLMQFTGLLGKNGQEIYEGDIVLHGGNKTAVRWADNLCAFWIGEILGLWKDDIEIIGNVWENPDLLTTNPT